MTPIPRCWALARNFVAPVECTSKTERCDCLLSSGSAGYKLFNAGRRSKREDIAMTWATPTLLEICIGLEINGYLPAEF